MTSAIERLSRIPYDFAFPSVGTPDIPQDAEFVDVTFPPAPGNHSRCECIKFHDYRAIYQHRGLYESLFHGRLQCQSPQSLVSLLTRCIPPSPVQSLSVLELGAGNGIVAEELRAQLGSSVGSLVGADLYPEARDAALRDRPGAFDLYLVGDFLAQDSEYGILKCKKFDVLVVCAALGPGWGDLPVEVVSEALTLLKDEGFVAITMNEKWLTDKPSGNALWNRLISSLKEGGSPIWHDLKECRRQNYRHRLDMRGDWIWYLAVVYQKRLK